jgi:ubiquinone/menaquinone biosynthesis C-methylase UbiE
MPIDFHDPRNRQTYTTREADPTWSAFIRANVNVTHKRVADVGCGGGIYTKALSQLGASHVVGVDFSEEMLTAAANHCNDIPRVTFHKGEAYQTGLPANEVDIVLERALIHHLNNLSACFQEAYRILKRGGVLIVQDRTLEDSLLPGDEHHIRGYFFERFPELKEMEVSRRQGSGQVQHALEAAGFRLVHTARLWETRRVYRNRVELKEDLLQRTGRSILHELRNTELQELVSFITSKLETARFPIIEKDAWTIWFATK